MPVAACGGPSRRGPRRRDRHDRGGWRGRPRRLRRPIRSLRACMLRAPSGTRMLEHTRKKRASCNRKRGVSRIDMCASVVRTRTDCETRPGRSPVCVSCVASVLSTSGLRSDKKAPECLPLLVDALANQFAKLVLFVTANKNRSQLLSGVPNPTGAAPRTSCASIWDAAECGHTKNETADRRRALNPKGVAPDS